MFSKSFLFMAFLMIHAVSAAQKPYIIDWKTEGQSFETFVIKAETRFNIRFYYEEEWVSGLVLKNYGDSLIMKNLLDSIFHNKQIYSYEYRTGRGRSYLRDLMR